MKIKIKREQLYEHLLERQFMLVERTIFDAILVEKDWMNKWIITQKQHNEFKEYALKIIKQTLKCSSKKAKLAFDQFIAHHGLLIKN